NGDQSLLLSDNPNGIWEGTWNPVNPQQSVKLTVLAHGPGQGGGILQTISTQVQVLPANTNAAPEALGAINAASFDRQNAGFVVPGSYVSIFGNRLADSASEASTIPLPFNLNDTQLLLAGQPLP